MKTKKHKKRIHLKGLTLIEMTVVIVVILILIGLSVFSVDAYRKWSQAVAASQVLREIYNAQRTFLSENPAFLPTDITAEMISPYLSYGESRYGVGVLPTIEDPDASGSFLPIDITVVPPILADDYDDSGSPSDGLWDVGE